MLTLQANDYFIPSMDVKYCDERFRMSVCLCLYVRISQKLTSKFHQIFYTGTYYVWLWLGLPLTLCTSGFVDDVMFSDNRANRRESKTTHMFRPVRQVAALRWGLLSLTSSCYYPTGPSPEALWIMTSNIIQEEFMCACYIFISSKHVANILTYLPETIDCRSIKVTSEHSVGLWSMRDGYLHLCSCSDIRQNRWDLLLSIYWLFTAKSVSERILEIGQNLVTLWRKI